MQASASILRPEGDEVVIFPEHGTGPPSCSLGSAVSEEGSRSQVWRRSRQPKLGSQLLFSFRVIDFRQTIATPFSDQGIESVWGPNLRLWVHKGNPTGWCCAKCQDFSGSCLGHHPPRMTLHSLIIGFWHNKG